MCEILVAVKGEWDKRDAEIGSSVFVLAHVRHGSAGRRLTHQLD